MDAVFWVVLGVVLAVAEIFTTTLFLIMFAVGAFAAAGAAALGAPTAVQAVVFAVVSALTVAVARPAIRRHSRSTSDGAEPIGLAAIEGSTALVLERVDAEQGLVKIDGELWSARSYDATQSFDPGRRVRVIKVQGATALVWDDDVSTSGELPEARG
ncbi:NfeD family protein [Micromonospora haikouensis]|uniref:Activity regulator of membrane protease YbbK n=1 Tax=Micromonospora haikouensis TaxID=686309 RepID=A0A0D0WUI1_9ACTN|nr:NfeD family protein [Micromonospora haikouensis]KIR61050.1 activity regulator of membrane protease YbbK [Micromonospora haikouensis]